MPKVKQPPTTRRAPVKDAAIIAPAAALPSAADLGRIYHQSMKQQAILDRAWLDAPDKTHAKYDAKEAFDQVENHGHMLVRLIMARPIATLEDVVAVAVHGFLEAEGAEQPELQRVLARIALVVGKVAGVEPGSFGSDDTANLLRRYAAQGRAA